MSKHCWKNGVNRLARCRVATDLLVKNAISAKHNKMRYACSYTEKNNYFKQYFEYTSIVKYVLRPNGAANTQISFSPLVVPMLVLLEIICMGAVDMCMRDSWIVM